MSNLRCFPFCSGLSLLRHRAELLPEAVQHEARRDLEDVLELSVRGVQSSAFDGAGALRVGPRKHPPRLTLVPRCSPFRCLPRLPRALNSIAQLSSILEQNGQQYENLDQDTSSIASDAISDCILASPLIDIPGSTLGLGSLVEVEVDSEKQLHGVIRWIGQKSNLDGMNGHGGAGDLVVGVELEEPCTDRRLKLNLSDGLYNGQRCFRCPERRAIFVPPKRCTKDRRFPDDPSESRHSSGSVRSGTPSEGRAFGADCPIIEGSIPALSELLKSLKET